MAEHSQQHHRTKVGVILSEYPGRPDEVERRKEGVLRSTPEGVDIEFLFVRGSMYVKGASHYNRTLVAPKYAEVALEGQRAGCDALVPYGTLDLGVEESRQAVDIPVMGPGRTGANVATMLAEQFAIVCYDEPHILMFERLVRQWRVDGYVTSVRSLDVPITEMSDDPVALRDRFVEVSKQAIEEEGAELILPLGMTTVPIMLSAADLTDAVGYPVLDPLALSIRTAEALAATGFRNSRRAYPPVVLA